MKLEFTCFDWDPGNLKKCKKHGVMKDEIESLFSSDNFFVGYDVKHSLREERYLAIGPSIVKDRYIFVAFTLRRISDELALRPITARYMHQKEIKKYEEAFAKAKE